MPENRTYHKSAKPRNWQNNRKGVARAFGESADYSDHQGCEALYANRPMDLIRSLRPLQWIKNLLLLAAPFFAWFDGKQAEFATTSLSVLGILLAKAIGAFVLFSAAVYILNDLHDRIGDAAHPLRKARPIAARQVSMPAALTLMILCLAGGAACAYLTQSKSFMIICGIYLFIQPCYTFLFRKIDGMGVLVVAAGFVLRAIGGAMVCNVRVSPWLLLCVFLLALFVALCKRRSEHFLRGATSGKATIPTVADGRILDLEIGATLATVITSYAMYTLSPATVENFGTDRLIYTLPLVVLGVFRYLKLTYADQKSNRPERIFTMDPVMICVILLWVATCGLILYTSKHPLF